MDNKEEGAFWCVADGCRGFALDAAGERNLHVELCRLVGMTADEIIEEWNRNSPPDDQW